MSDSLSRGKDRTRLAWPCTANRSLVSVFRDCEERWAAVGSCCSTSQMRLSTTHWLLALLNGCSQALLPELPSPGPSAQGAGLAWMIPPLGQRERLSEGGEPRQAIGPRAPARMWNTPGLLRLHCWRLNATGRWSLSHWGLGDGGGGGMCAPVLPTSLGRACRGSCPKYSLHFLIKYGTTKHYET